MTEIENELFEKWWDGEGQFHRAGGGDYEKTFAYHAWQASANREGYKLVPVDALEILIMYGTQYANEYDIDNLHEALELTK